MRMCVRVNVHVRARVCAHVHVHPTQNKHSTGVWYGFNSSPPSRSHGDSQQHAGWLQATQPPVNRRHAARRAAPAWAPRPRPHPQQLPPLSVARQHGLDDRCVVAHHLLLHVEDLRVHAPMDTRMDTRMDTAVQCSAVQCSAQRGCPGGGELHRSVHRVVGGLARRAGSQPAAGQACAFLQVP